MDASGLHRRALVTDALLAVGFAAVALVELTQPVEERHARASFAVDAVIQVLFCSTLLLRSRRPVAGLAAMNAIFLLPALVTAHAGFLFANSIPLLIMTFTVARHDHGLWSRWAWLSGVVLWLGLVLHAGPYLRQVANPLLPVGMSVMAWLIARVLHRYQVQRGQLVAARDQLAAEQAIRRGVMVDQERARIAADMHDVVAHAVSLMVVQVGAARMSVEKTGPQQPGLRAAEKAGRQALVELRRSLGVLRADGQARPTPGIASLPELVASEQARGLDARLTFAVELSDGLTAGLQLAVYRLVEEALSYLREAGGRTALGSVESSADGLVLHLSSSLGSGATPPSSALMGMYERVAAFGGALDVQQSAGQVDLRATLALHEAIGPLAASC